MQNRNGHELDIHCCPLKEYDSYLLNETATHHVIFIRIPQESHKRVIFFSSHFFSLGNAMVTRKFKTLGASSCNSKIMFPK